MTKRKTPTSREAFTDWVLEKGYPVTLSFQREHYKSDYVEGAWQGWQAALRYAKGQKEK